MGDWEWLGGWWEGWEECKGWKGWVVGLGWGRDKRLKRNWALEMGDLEWRTWNGGLEIGYCEWVAGIGGLEKESCN